MATSIPVQMTMGNNGHKQANGSIPVSSPQPMAPPTNPSNILMETTAGTWLAIGSLAESLGDVEKALASYDSALRHSPNNPEILTKLANMYRSKDVFFKAAELYEQALNFHPENGEDMGIIGTLLLDVRRFAKGICVSIKEPYITWIIQMFLSYGTELAFYTTDMVR